MQNLMSIGRFSERSGLTIKALRLYDKVGLLPPAVVDFSSGYRYYSPEQLLVARRIRLLRSLDMPLGEIRALLSANEPDVIHMLLARHGRRMAERIAHYQQVLDRVPTLEEWCSSTGKEESVDRESKLYRCSFCGKDNAHVGRMIAGPKGVFICDECVTRCNELIAQEETRELGA